ncbi:hypothetical protein NQ318_021433, partial [Aromia moschata]
WHGFGTVPPTAALTKSPGMLHRSTSSRRRRASRSAASSPQTRGTRSAATSPGRRASIAVSPVDTERAARNALAPEMNRSPRHSIIPDISLDSHSGGEGYDRGPRSTLRDRLSKLVREVAKLATQPLTDPECAQLSPINIESLQMMSGDEFETKQYPTPPPSGRNQKSLAPDFDRSPRNSLVPDSQRSPRHSLVPTESYSRSPRNSLVPDSALSPRNSLVPDQYNRSPRNSLVPDTNRTPRHSLTPESSGVYGSRLNIVEHNRSARNSLVPENGRTPRASLTPSESTTWMQEEGPCRVVCHWQVDSHRDVTCSQKYSLFPLTVNRSPRHSIVPDSNRSPRGSIAPEGLCVRTSPRGSIAGGEYLAERSPRGSIGAVGENGENRSPRGSIARSTLMTDDCCEKRSPRGSLTLTFQEPPATERRASADNPTGELQCVQFGIKGMI